MTHASDASEKPRSVRIDGSATPTIVTSKTIISSPRQRTSSASQRASCARAPPRAPLIPVPAPAVRFATALPSRLAPGHHALRAPAGCASRQMPGPPEPAQAWRGLAEAAEQPRATHRRWEPLAGCAAATAPAIGHVTARAFRAPTLPLLLRAARCLLVVNDQHARAGGGHARELQLLVAAGPGEQRLARAQHDGIDHEPQLVDETMLQQQPHE